MTVSIRLFSYDGLIRIFLLTLVASAGLIATNLHSQTFDYNHLRSEYFKLKNTDPQMADGAKWTEVLEKYNSAGSSYASILPDRFYLDYAGILKELYLAREDPRLLEKSIDATDDLVNKFPKSELADDAILKKSELLALAGNSTDIVNQTLAELVSKYPDSDSAQVARIKIANNQSTTVNIAGKSEIKTQSVSGLPVVVIDPGHGGEDFGAQSELGLLEKDVALSISLDIEKILIAQGIANPVLTRKSDIFVPLKQRVEQANAQNAALFVSIHSNASPEQNQTGLTTYILDDSTDEASRLLAERENKSAGSHDMSDLQFILGDLIQSSKHPKSILLAETLEKQLLTAAGSRMKPLKNNKIKKAPFFVLVGARMPCALLELFFIDQQKDAEFLADPAFRKDLAQGVASGIKVFLEKLRA